RKHGHAKEHRTEPEHSEAQAGGEEAPVIGNRFEHRPPRDPPIVWRSIIARLSQNRVVAASVAPAPGQALLVRRHGSFSSILSAADQQAPTLRARTSVSANFVSGIRRRSGSLLAPVLHFSAATRACAVVATRRKTHTSVSACAHSKKTLHRV